jgi:penicillin-binding protein 1C
MFRRIRTRKGILVAVAVAMLGIATVWWVVPWCVPLPGRLLRPQPLSPTFLSADGMPLRQLLSTDGQRVARVVTYEELPPMLIYATLAAEDKRFFSHGGVDVLAVSRAVWDNVASRRVVSGASTLTQQLAKVSADQPSDRTWSAKIVEAMQARRLEMTWTKERILTEYLNRVNYGNLLTGCASAADGYFHKPLRDLTPAECALLAALPQSPTRLNPFRNMKGVEKRKKLILERMAELGWLDHEAKSLALTEKAVLQRYTGGFEAPHAVEMFRNADTPLCLGGSDPETMAGTSIRLTLDSAAQRLVEHAIEKHLASLAAKHVTQSAAVIIENKTGKVLALAGSRDYFSADGGQLNGAWVPHSPGSALKPFTYLLAFDRGFTPASVIADLPVEYATTTGLYRPENYDRKNYGPVTVRDALGNSLNIPAVKTLRKIGGEEVLYDTLQSLGITTLTEPPEHYGLGLTIGNAPVRLLELANAYACLARLGEWKEYSLVVPPSGGQETASVRLKAKLPCYLIADILSDPQARLISFGPRTVIRLPFRCAVKTGTSTNYRDNWTLGYTPEFTVGVWCGNFDNSPMANVSGISGAGPIFREIMMWLHEKRGTTWYAEPDGIAHATIDPRNGKRLDATSPPARTSRDEIFPAGALPPPATAQDYDGEGRAILPPEYASWIAQGDHWLTGQVIARADKRVGMPPHILNPANGSVFVLDPDLPDQGGRLLLRAVGGGTVRWSCRTLAVSTADGLCYATLTPGAHELCVVDEASGAVARARIEVRPAHSPSEAR